MESKKSRSETSIRRLKLRRSFRFLGALTLAAVILGSAGYWLFVGWRARDLALKSRDNLENANYRMAWLQAESARNLRPEEPEVLRTSAIVDAAFGRKESLEAWRRLAEVANLTPDDQEQRARAATRFDDRAQFDAALEALDTAGRRDASTRLRTANQLSRGDLQSAIEQARRRASFSDDPRLRLDLAKLLLRRYVDDLASSPADGSPARQAFNEMTAIVTSLQSDPETGPEALAFGLTFLLPGPAVQKAWADIAMARMEPGNPALLSAATILIDNKHTTPEQLACATSVYIRRGFPRPTRGLCRMAHPAWSCPRVAHHDYRAGGGRESEGVSRAHGSTRQRRELERCHGHGGCRWKCSRFDTLSHAGARPNMPCARIR
jgi:hypothetical protein